MTFLVNDSCVFIVAIKNVLPSFPQLFIQRTEIHLTTVADRLMAVNLIVSSRKVLHSWLVL